MRMTRIESKVIAAWQQAATDLGFQFTSPFVGHDSNGKRFEALGLVHQFGRHIGTLISVGGEPSADIEYPSDNNFTWSCLGRTGYVRYERQMWIDTLNDWQFVGSESERPSWYLSKSWG
jgi:hypothetical protein